MRDEELDEYMASTIAVPLVGNRYTGNKPVDGKVQLCAEEENQYDPRAIAVYQKSSGTIWHKKIGYLPEQVAAVMTLRDTLGIDHEMVGNVIAIFCGDNDRTKELKSALINIDHNNNTFI